MHIKLIILSSLLLYFCKSVQNCQNNSTLIQETSFCVCQPGFIGGNCSIKAYQLNDTQVNIPINQNFSFAYYKPQQKVIYRILLTFCSSNASQILDFIVYVQQQQQTGVVEQLPRRQRQTLQMMVGGSYGCKNIYSNVLVSVDKKPNGQILKIVFGFKLIGQSVQLKNQSITVKCETSSIFTVSFLATILISFLVIVSTFVLISIVFVLRKKWMQRNAQRQESMKKLNCVNNLMPSQKYQNLIQQSDIKHQQNDLICSICLCDFGKGQDVRKTPCGHIYHSACLQSWCNANLNCPICRQSFQKQQELALVQEGLRPENNIRDRML